MAPRTELGQYMSESSSESSFYHKLTKSKLVRGALGLFVAGMGATEANASNQDVATAMRNQRREVATGEMPNLLKTERVNIPVMDEPVADDGEVNASQEVQKQEIKSTITLKEFALTSKEKSELGTSNFVPEAGSALDQAVKALEAEYNLPEGILKTEIFHNKDKTKAVVVRTFIKEQPTKDKSGKDILFKKGSMLATGGIYMIAEIDSDEVVVSEVTPEMHDFIGNIEYIDGSKSEAPAVGSLIINARDIATKKITAFQTLVTVKEPGKDDQYVLVATTIKDKSLVKNAPEPVVTEEAPQAVAKIDVGAPSKGLEYYKSLSQEQLVSMAKEVESSGAFKFKDFDNLKPLSTSYFEGSNDSNTPNTVDVYIFPYLLEEPTKITIETKDVITGELVKIETFHTFVLMQTKGGRFGVVEVIFTGNAIDGKMSTDRNADGTVGGSPKADIKPKPMEEFMASLDPDNQYGFQVYVPTRSNSGKNFYEYGKKVMGNRLTPEREVLLRKIATLMAYTENGNRQLPQQLGSGNILKIPNSPILASTVMTGPNQ